MRLPRVRLTARAMMGVVLIAALLMPGALFVLRSTVDPWAAALAVALFYVIASPAVLAITSPFFWPKP